MLHERATEGHSAMRRMAKGAPKSAGCRSPADPAARTQRMAAARLFDLDALLLEVFERAGVPGDAGPIGGLPFPLDIQCLLVHQRQLVLLLEHQPCQVVGE